MVLGSLEIFVVWTGLSLRWPDILVKAELIYENDKQAFTRDWSADISQN